MTLSSTLRRETLTRQGVWGQDLRRDETRPRPQQSGLEGGHIWEGLSVGDQGPSTSFPFVGRHSTPFWNTGVDEIDYKSTGGG